MEYETATRKQLLQITLHEPCSIDDKYEACREIQLRKWNDDMMQDLVRLWGQGLSCFQVSIEMGLPESTIRTRLIKYGLWGTRVHEFNKLI